MERPPEQTSPPPAGSVPPLVGKLRWHARHCLGCGQQYAVTLFIADLCPACFATGVPYPDEERAG